MRGSCEHGNEPLHTIKGRQFIYCFGDYNHLRATQEEYHAIFTHGVDKNARITEKLVAFVPLKHTIKTIDLYTVFQNTLHPCQKLTLCLSSPKSVPQHC